MPLYDPSSTLRDSRQQYFDANGFRNGGYDDRWVALKAGPIRFRFPNTKARVRAVKLHDLHHVLTEYDTTWSGEAEIGAWEIASGCGRYSAAWLLNFGAFAIGLFLAPRLVFRAFIRGRHTTNLYDQSYREEMLDRQVGEVRSALQIDRRLPAASSRDVAAFVWWSLVALVMSILPWLCGFAAIAAIVLHLRR